MKKYIVSLLLSTVTAGAGDIAHIRILYCEIPNRECSQNDICLIEVFSSYDEFYKNPTQIHGTVTWQHANGDTKISMPAMIAKSDQSFTVKNSTDYPPPMTLSIPNILAKSQGTGELTIRPGKVRKYNCKRFADPK